MAGVWAGVGPGVLEGGLAGALGGVQDGRGVAVGVVGPRGLALGFDREVVEGRGLGRGLTTRL